MIRQVNRQWNTSASPAPRCAYGYKQWLLNGLAVCGLQLSGRGEIRESSKYGSNRSFADRWVREGKRPSEAPLKGWVCANTTEDHVHEGFFIKRTDESFGHGSRIFNVALENGEAFIDGAWGDIMTVG